VATLLLFRARQCDARSVNARPPGGPRSPFVTYPFALACVVVAVFLRWLLDPLMGNTLPLVTLFGAVAAAVWLGGVGPALFVVIVGYAACNYAFISPRFAFENDLGTWVGMIAYLCTCAVIIGLGEATRTAQSRATQQREVFRVTLRSIGDAVITTDVEGRITSLNAVAESLTGWALRDALGKPLDVVFRVFNETTRAPVENPAMRALRDGVVVGLANHSVLVRKDGVECAIDDSAAPIRDENDRVSGCVLIFRDVSVQRRVERDRVNQLATARLLASIVESSDDAIVSKSLEGVIQTWNAGAERMFGYTAAEAVGRHISLVIPEERLAEEDDIIATLKEGRRVEHFETVRVRADGQRILVSLTISPIRDDSGNVVGASKIARDVTRQRRTEERERLLLAEAAEANVKFRAFFDQGALFAGILDPEGTLLEPNRMSLEACGYTREQVIGKPFWHGPWWNRSPDVVKQIRDACAQAAAGRTFRAELPYFLADGSQRIADIAIQPIRNDAGRVLFLAPTGTDITARKQAEADREKMAEDLAEADRRKDEFLATLAHELRNPLAPLSNMLEVLKRADGDRETVRRARDTMDRQLGQLVRLVDDLLDLNRITHNRLELRPKQVELASVIQQAVEAAHPLVDAAQHVLSVHLPSEPIHLRADPARLAQVFGNLLNNASKYTPAGGKIDLSAERRGNDVVVTVKDSGIGIPHEKLDQIFDMFAQAAPSFDQSMGGLGIGLTLAKRLVLMHGGSIEAKSEGEGRGSEFVVRLPVLADALVPETTPIPSEMDRSPSRRILIVDDNSDSAVSLAHLLDIMGNETFVAHDGERAIDAIEKHRPAVALVDIGLPKLDGYEVCRQVRTRPWGKDMTLIALTGWGQEEDRRKSREAGFDGHLVKPVDYAELVRLLDSLMSPERDSS
jgi:PAS domain S-box-containing protein